MIYANDGSAMLSQAEIDKLIQEMEKEKEEQKTD